MKLEYTPIFDWQKFNYLGKRLFDFANLKLNAATSNYIGDASSSRNINVDIIPRLIIIFGMSGTPPVIWMDKFTAPLSKLFDGTDLTDAILGLSDRKEAFKIGPNVNVNSNGVNYTYIVLGS